MFGLQSSIQERHRAVDRAARIRRRRRELAVLPSAVSAGAQWQIHEDDFCPFGDVVLGVEELDRLHSSYLEVLTPVSSHSSDGRWSSDADESDLSCTLLPTPHEILSSRHTSMTDATRTEDEEENEKKMHRPSKGARRNTSHATPLGPVTPKREAVQGGRPPSGSYGGAGPSSTLPSAVLSRTGSSTVWSSSRHTHALGTASPLSSRHRAHSQKQREGGDGGTTTTPKSAKGEEWQHRKRSEDGGLAAAPFRSPLSFSNTNPNRKRPPLSTSPTNDHARNPPVPPLHSLFSTHPVSPRALSSASSSAAAGAVRPRPTRPSLSAMATTSPRLGPTATLPRRARTVDGDATRERPKCDQKEEEVEGTAATQTIPTPTMTPPLDPSLLLTPASRPSLAQEEQRGSGPPPTTPLLSPPARTASTPSASVAVAREPSAPPPLSARAESPSFFTALQGSPIFPPAFVLPPSVAISPTAKVSPPRAAAFPSSAPTSSISLTRRGGGGGRPALPPRPPHHASSSSLTSLPPRWSATERVGSGGAGRKGRDTPSPPSSPPSSSTFVVATGVALTVQMFLGGWRENPTRLETAVSSVPPPVTVVGCPAKDWKRMPHIYFPEEVWKTVTEEEEAEERRSGAGPVAAAVPSKGQQTPSSATAPSCRAPEEGSAANATAHDANVFPLPHHPEGEESDEEGRRRRRVAPPPSLFMATSPPSVSGGPLSPTTMGPPASLLRSPVVQFLARRLKEEEEKSSGGETDGREEGIHSSGGEASPHTEAEAKKKATTMAPPKKKTRKKKRKLPKGVDHEDDGGDGGPCSTHATCLPASSHHASTSASSLAAFSDCSVTRGPPSSAPLSHSYASEDGIPHLHRPPTTHRKGSGPLRRDRRRRSSFPPPLHPLSEEGGGEPAISHPPRTVLPVRPSLSIPTAGDRPHASGKGGRPASHRSRRPSHSKSNPARASIRQDEPSARGSRQLLTASPVAAAFSSSLSAGMPPLPTAPREGEEGEGPLPSSVPPPHRPSVTGDSWSTPSFTSSRSLSQWPSSAPRHLNGSETRGGSGARAHGPHTSLPPPLSAPVPLFSPTDSSPPRRVSAAPAEGAEPASAASSTSPKVPRMAFTIRDSSRVYGSCKYRKAKR